MDSAEAYAAVLVQLSVVILSKQAGPSELKYG